MDRRGKGGGEGRRRGKRIGGEEGKRGEDKRMGGGRGERGGRPWLFGKHESQHKTYNVNSNRLLCLQIKSWGVPLCWKHTNWTSV